MRCPCVPEAPIIVLGVLRNKSSRRYSRNVRYFYVLISLYDLNLRGLFNSEEGEDESNLVFSCGLMWDQ